MTAARRNISTCNAAEFLPGLPTPYTPIEYPDSVLPARVLTNPGYPVLPPIIELLRMAAGKQPQVV